MQHICIVYTCQCARVHIAIDMVMIATIATAIVITYKPYHQVHYVIRRGKVRFATDARSDDILPKIISHGVIVQWLHLVRFYRQDEALKNYPQKEYNFVQNQD